MASKGQKRDWRQASLCPELSHPRTRLPTQPPASSPLSLRSLLTAPCCLGMGTAPPCQMGPPTTGRRTSSLALPFRWFREAETSLTVHTSESPHTASKLRMRAAKRRSHVVHRRKRLSSHRETTQMAWSIHRKCIESCYQILGHLQISRILALSHKEVSLAKGQLLIDWTNWSELT